MWTLYIAAYTFKMENWVVENKFMCYSVRLHAYILTHGRRREECIHSTPSVPCPKTIMFLFFLQMTLNAFYQYLG